LPASLVEDAPAKVNLTLRVLGRRADGYHEIESLVAFASAGDALSFAPGGALALTVRGPSAAQAGATADNLVLKAAHALADRLPTVGAGTFDLETVATLGVNVRNLRTFNFAVGCLLAGLSGVLAAGQIGLNPNMGDDLLMPSFIAIIVGGVGSLIGTLCGGLLIGMAAALTTVFYPAASEAVVYAILMAVLLLRPRGLLGEEGMFS